MRPLHLGRGSRRSYAGLRPINIFATRSVVSCRFASIHTRQSPLINTHATRSVVSCRFASIHTRQSPLTNKHKKTRKRINSLRVYYACSSFLLLTRLFYDCSNTTRTYSTSTFTDSECKTLFHSYWMDKFDSHFYVIARHTHFCTSW